MFIRHGANGHGITRTCGQYKSRSGVRKSRTIALTCSQIANQMDEGLGLHVISRKRLVEAAAEHPQLIQPLDAWYRIAKRAEWRNLMDVRREFPSADAVWKFTIFNIKGNAYRLITEINYRTGRVFLRDVLTHAEYTRGGWKK